MQHALPPATSYTPKRSGAPSKEKPVYHSVGNYNYSATARLLDKISVYLAAILAIVSLVLGIGLGYNSYSWGIFFVCVAVGAVVTFFTYLFFRVAAEFLENSARQTELLRLSLDEDKVKML